MVTVQEGTKNVKLRNSHMNSIPPFICARSSMCTCNSRRGSICTQRNKTDSEKGMTVFPFINTGVSTVLR